ncbi:MAG: AAA family ATPase [Thermoguttaceae bacterium]
MEYTIVLETDQLVARAHAAGLNAVKIPAADEMAEPMEGVVIVMADNETQKIAQGLADNGLDEIMVEWIDGSEFEGGISGLLDAGIEVIAPEARDLYFDEIRSLLDAEADPAMQERIPAGPDWAERNVILRRRELIVVCGAYGCGKSTVTQYFGIEWCMGPGALYEEGHSKASQRRERPVWFCTWEDDPMEQKEQVLRRITNGRCENASPDQIREARRIQGMILHTRPEADIDRDFNWYGKRARYMNKKYGTNFFVLDPWSEFDHIMEKNEQETQYVKKVMKELNKLCVELNAIFIVVTHITKSKYSDDMGIKPFRVADAMGSVQFGSTATRGICVARTSTLAGNGEHTVLYFDKVKISNGPNTMGKDREVVALSLHEDRHELIQDLDATMDAAAAWGCAGGGKMDGKRPKKRNKKDGKDNNDNVVSINKFVTGGDE